MEFNIPFKLDEKEIQGALDKSFRSFVADQQHKFLSNMFYDEHNSYFKIKKDSDTGYFLKRIQNIMTEVTLDPKWDEYAKNYIERNFEKHMNEALDKAMERKARKMAFLITASDEFKDHRG